MSDNNITVENTQKNETQPATKLTIDYVLDRIEEVKINMEFFAETAKEIGQICSGGPGDIGAQALADSLGEAIKAHAATSQRLLDLYERMYDDLCGKKSKQETKQDMIMTIVTTAISEGSDLDDINALIATLQAF